MGHSGRLLALSIRDAIHGVSFASVLPSRDGNNDEASLRTVHITTPNYLTITLAHVVLLILVLDASSGSSAARSVPLAPPQISLTAHLPGASERPRALP